MADKPDVSRIDLGKCIAKDYPGGDSGGVPGELRVVLGRRAYDEIRKHAAEETDREICGVLLGDLSKDAKGPFLHITEVIRGEHTASQGAQVTITHETWNHFHKIKDSKFADKQYLGWYHSHPDFGIFLSSMDLFIHENFFSAPHQVALVVDPLRNEEGMFVWKEGKPERAGAFWVGREPHRYEPEPEPSQEERSLREIEKKLERLKGQLGELQAAVQQKPEGDWLQTVLLMGILLFLVVQGVFGVFGGRGQGGPSTEDQARRRLVGLSEDPKTGDLLIDYNMPSPMYLKVPPTAPLIFSDGSSRLSIRMSQEDFLRQFMPEALKAKQSAGKGDKGDKAGDAKDDGTGKQESPAPPPTTPTPPAAPAGQPPPAASDPAPAGGGPK
ncbi:MAG TPA: Mov34/MPN/PAD-1 family protein [Planctomycetota bacterium]|nr:Mov34/MPN/PAD-1 family protein [Planctomycetota bacterium]